MVSVCLYLTPGHISYSPHTGAHVALDSVDAVSDITGVVRFASPSFCLAVLFSVDERRLHRETGDLRIGDVGQNFWEEIDFEPASSEGGFNHGWKFLQGAHCFPNSLEPDCPKVGVLPVAEYAHEPTGGSTVIGGHVYRGGAYPALEGIYFVSDYVSGRVWGIARGENGEWVMEELLNTRLFVTGAGEDEAGNISFTSCECGYGQTAPNSRGELWMLVAADQAPEDATLAPPDQ